MYPIEKNEDCPDVEELANQLTGSLNHPGDSWSEEEIDELHEIADGCAMCGRYNHIEDMEESRSWGELVCWRCYEDEEEDEDAG